MRMNSQYSNNITWGRVAIGFSFDQNDEHDFLIVNVRRLT